MSTYLRELAHARRDAGKLCDILHPPHTTLDDLTVTQLAEAIGLADAVRRALLGAIGARALLSDQHHHEAAPPVTSRRGLELIGRTP